MIRHYLSAYLPPAGSAALYTRRHDQSVALWRDDGDKLELVRYWELERLSGLKHHAWPILEQRHQENLISTLLQMEGLALEDISLRWGLDSDDNSMIRELAAEAGVSVHSLGHLFSSLLMDSRKFSDETILALAIDGGPDFAIEQRVPPYWYCAALVRAGNLQVLPVQSPGMLYTAAVVGLGREPGTLMAVTALCGCVAELSSLNDDLLADSTFFGAIDNGWGRAVEAVNQAISDANELIALGEIGHCGVIGLEPTDHVRTVVMRRVQALAENLVVSEVRRIAKKYELDTSSAYLGMAGGSALNCPTNSRLLRTFEFKGLLCPPSANDSGQALGLGLAGMYLHGILPKSEFVLEHAYYGLDVLDLAAALEEFDASVVSVSETFDDATFVRDVTAGPVAWIEGQSEIGPRALGHRSLLADPRQEQSKKLLNQMKSREWWRPVAPIVLEASCADWFAGGHRSPFMLETFDVMGSVRERVPAVVHLDGSARLQTIGSESGSRLFAALTAFFRDSGVPMLCNTSLNSKGEPMVQTVAEALTFCLRKSVRVLYVDGVRIELDLDASKIDDEPRARMVELFEEDGTALAQIWRNFDEVGIDSSVLAVVERSPGLRRALTSPSGIAKLKSLSQRVQSQDPAWALYVEHLEETYGRSSSFTRSFDRLGSTEDHLMPLLAQLNE